MMLRKRAAAVIISAAISVSMVTAVSAGVSAEWVKSGSDYSYKDDSTGKKLTGWQDINGGRYYFDKNGKALTGWKKINGDTYYFNASKKGKMITSWATIGGTKYYFGKDGVMRTGWVKLSGNTYYFGNDGKMRTGKVKINGVIYNFGKNGILLGSSSLSSGKKIDDYFKGMDFGMTKKQVIARLPYDNYAVDGSMIVAFPDKNNENEGAFYVLDVNGKLCSYGYMVVGKNANKSDMEALFENAGWELLGSEDGSKVYASADYSSMGIVLSDSEMVMATVYSGEIIEEVMSGNTSVFDHIK